MKNIFFFLLVFSFSVFANPQGMDVISGNVSVAHLDNTLKIEVSDKAIINWNSFSIEQGESTSFLLPSNGSAVLNRVTGKIQSEILGSLLSNGKVYLLNPCGIIIGSGALINTASFIASTYDILDEVFLNGKDLLFFGDSKEKVINLGTIKALDGDVILIGRYVENKGSIEAKKGTVSIGAGKEILLKLKEKDGIYIKLFLDEGEVEAEPGITNEGELSSCSTYLKADGYMYSLAIKDSGKIDALSFEEKNGQIFLVAEGGRVESSGMMNAKRENNGGEVRLLGKEVGLLDKATIDVSGEEGGGKVLIGGDRSGKNPEIYNAEAVYFAKDAHIKADSFSRNDGGKVIVWSNKATVFLGEISAEAKGLSGDGGFVEVSSENFLAPQGRVSTRSLKGKTGTYFLDPCDITISLFGPPSVPPFPTSGNDYYPTGTSANLNVGDLVTGLTTNNVIVSTAASGPDFGDITLSTPLTIPGAFTLTLNADRNILINSDLTVGSGLLTMTAGGKIEVNNANLGGVGTGAISLTAKTGDISVYGNTSQAFIQTSGIITLSAKGNINVGSASSSFDSQINALLTGTISLSVGNTLLITGGDAAAARGLIQTAGGNIVIVASTVSLYGGTASACAAGITNQGSGNITITAPSGATSGALNLFGGSAAGAIAGISTNVGGTVEIVTVGDATLKAGSSTSCDAFVAGGIVVGPGSVKLTSKNLIITGGQAASSPAYLSSSLTGNLSFTVESLRLTSGANGAAQIHSGSGGVSNITGSATNGITLESYGAIAEINSTYGAGLGDITLSKAGPITMTSNAVTGGCYITSGGIVSLEGVTSITMHPQLSPTIINTTIAGKNITINSAAPGSGGLSLNVSAAPNIAAIYTNLGGDITLNFSGVSNITAGTSPGGNIDSGIMTGYTSGGGKITGSLGSLTIQGGNGSASKASAGLFTGYNLGVHAGSGDIDLSVSSLAMTGGGATFHQADILTGSAGGAIKIKSTGTMTLTGGTGDDSCAEIATLGAGAQTININAASLTLQGSNSVTAQRAKAQVYTLLGGDITIGDLTVGSISLIGGAGIDNQASIVPFDAYNVTISSSNLILQGGSGQNAYAVIFATSNGALSFPVIGGMSLIGGTNTNTYASITTQAGDITINSSAAPRGYLNLRGGVAGTSHAEISSTNAGDVNAYFALGGTMTGESGNTSYARINAIGGDINTSFGLDCSIAGGSGNTSYASIYASSGDIDLKSRNLTLIGSTNDVTSYAAIDAPSGIVNVASTGSINIQADIAPAYIKLAQDITVAINIFLNAGASQAYIKTANTGTTPIIIAGRNLSINGGSNAVAEITSGAGATDLSVFVGNSMFIWAGAQDASINGYNTLNLTAIGRSSLKSSSIAGSGDGYILVNKDLNMNTGSMGLFGGNSPSGSAKAYLKASGDLHLNVLYSDLVILGGAANGSDAYIDINGTSSIFVQGILDVFSTGSGKSYIQSNGYDSFHVDRDIIILGNADDTAFIKDLSSQDFTLSATGNISLIDHAKIENVGGVFTIIAGDNLVLSADSQILNDSSSDLTLVIDNNYPSYPSAGEGHFDISADSIITNTPVGSGQVRIFTVQPGFNMVYGQLNGYFLTLGPILADSPLERWGVYYPDSYFGGPGFTMFYKISEPFARLILGAIMKANSELFYRLNNMREDFYVMDFYDRYIRRAKVFCVDYDLKEYRGLSEYQECSEYTINLTFD